MEILLRLIIAHIITDFFIQPNHWVAEKKEKKYKSRSLYIHILVTTMAAWIALWDWQLWYVALGVGISHLLIDLYKLTFTKDNVASFVYDQIFHVLVLILAASYIGGSMEGFRRMFSLLEDETALALIVGYLIVSMPVGYLVGMSTRRWREEITSDLKERDSLKDAGIYIGVLERILVFTFVIFDQFQAMGFLIAAKSILRFSNKDDTNPRKQTEYVLIGTLISFTIALFVGLGVKHVLGM